MMAKQRQFQLFNRLHSAFYRFRTLTVLALFAIVLPACVTPGELGAYIEHKHEQQEKSLSNVRKKIDYITGELGFKRFKVDARSKYSPVTHDYISRIGGSVATRGAQEYELEVEVFKRVDREAYDLAYRIRTQARLIYLGAQGGPLVLFESEAREWCRPDFCDLAESKAVRNALLSF